VNKHLFKSNIWRTILAMGLVLSIVLLLLVVTPASDARVELAILHYDDDCGSGVLCGPCPGAWSAPIPLSVSTALVVALLTPLGWLAWGSRSAARAETDFRWRPWQGIAPLVKRVAFAAVIVASCLTLLQAYVVERRLATDLAECQSAEAECRARPVAPCVKRDPAPERPRAGGCKCPPGDPLCSCH
jgi:hypothetical protein